MQCPVCTTELVRKKYESFLIRHCPGCFGYLLTPERLASLKSQRNLSIDQLKKEVIEENRPNSEETLRCPRCRAKMKKRMLPPPASVEYDLCNSCKFVWLDGGEMARIQLAHEVSGKGRNAAKMQDNFWSRTEEEHKEIQEQIDKLPEKHFEETTTYFIIDCLINAIGNGSQKPFKN
jgi:Zn-finger nucleic acid-binding protein